MLKSVKNSTKLNAAALLTGSILVSGCVGKSVQSGYLGPDLISTESRADREFSGPRYSLPKSLVSFSATRVGGILTITKPVVKHVPDPRASYALAFLPSGLANDDFTVEIGTNGLLKSSKVINEDKTPAIVDQGIGILGELIKLSAKVAPSTKKPTQDFKVEVAFDPHDPAQVNYATNKLRQVGKLELVLKDVDGHFLYPGHPLSASDQNKYQTEVVDVAEQCEGSFCFRVQRPIIVEVIGTGDSANQRTRNSIMVADHRMVGSLDITRAACVKKTNTLTFSEGFLTKTQVQKPSEVKGCLSIPATVVKAVLGFPG